MSLRLEEPIRKPTVETLSQVNYSMEHVRHISSTIRPDKWKCPSAVKLTLLHIIIL